MCESPLDRTTEKAKHANIAHANIAKRSAPARLSRELAMTKPFERARRIPSANGNSHG
jgi:hypothetical protein